MNYSNDDFIRTTEARHATSVQALWRAMEANGDIYLGSYAGWYSVRDEAFYAENEVTAGPDGKKVGPMVILFSSSSVSENCSISDKSPSSMLLSPSSLLCLSPELYG